MHGCSLASGLPVNAEVDSMGGVVEVGDGVGTSTSPRRAAIKKVQSEIRQEYDVREERRRELEFLEKGGNPLDFKFGTAASASVQSTSLTDQHPEFFLTSEAKGSFALTASTHGDSVESSDRPGDQSACEPISADNLMLFDGANDSIEGHRISGRPNRSNIASRDHSFNLAGTQNGKILGDVGPVGPKKLYNRRKYRSRQSRESPRSSSSDAVLPRGINGSSLHSFIGSRDFKGLVSDRGLDQKVSLNGDLKPTSPISTAVCQTAPSSTQVDSEVDIVKAREPTTDVRKDDLADNAKDSDSTKNLHDDKLNVDSLCGVPKCPTKQSIEESYASRAPEEVVVKGIDSRPSVPVSIVETHAFSGQINGSSSGNVDVTSIPNSGRTNNTKLDPNISETVSGCTQSRLSLDGNNDDVMCTNDRYVDTTNDINELSSAVGGDETIQARNVTNELDETKDDGIDIVECAVVQQSLKENDVMLKPGEELNAEISDLQNEVESKGQKEYKDQDMVESMDVDGYGVSVTGMDANVPLVDNMNPKDDNVCKVGPEGSSVSSILKLPDTEPSVGVSNSASVVQTLCVQKASRADEDSILEEARTIEVKRKRIAQLSLSDTSVDIGQKSHWDFVLEEMAWLANDFAQERLWKLSTASQLGHRVSLLSRLKFHEKNSRLEGQKVARFLARAVMEFWSSLERKIQGQELQSRIGSCSPALWNYALRFRKNDALEVRPIDVEAPATPDRVSDVGIMDISLNERSKEVNIFYLVPPGAMERYRNLVGSFVAKYEKTGSNVRDEFETSTSDALADFVSPDNAYEEDEGETSTYNMSATLDSKKPSKYIQKKLKISTKGYGSRKAEAVVDSPFLLCMDSKVGSQPPVLLGKRPGNSLNVSFPTKRVRTSNRPRVSCTFTAGTSAYVHGPTKADASSGDTNSFQDDQSTLDGVSHALNNIEVESVGDFEKNLGYDSAEMSMQTKKKKARQLGSAYEQKCLVDSNFQHDQRDHSKKRLENHQFESNGSSGFFGHHIAKKSKMMRQNDNAIDSSAQLGGSVPSPVASQIGNPNKFIKYLGGRDHRRKTKLLKIPANQPGPGSPWSLFEEQALVVLVHDLGPNWELVSDAINSTLQFKCIFRNAKECKERHKQLMDRTSGDGADSAEDSGSSQPYSSTLPGIPKGSARQLFQRLQGPMEEDTLKSHFEKIIMIGQKLHCRRKQEPKQIQSPHGSHMVALAQVYPNNLSGGNILTPLDLSDATVSSSDILPHGYPGVHSGALPTSNQGTMTPMLTASGAHSPVLGSSNVTTGNNFSSSPVPVNASPRDAKYAVSRAASLTIEEQRMQQYNQMFPGRNLTQPNMSSPGPPPAIDRSGRILPGGNVVPITGGGNRSLPAARPGFQGVASPSMLNAGSTVSSGMVTMPGSGNIHAGVGCGQGNSLRSREALHMVRPAQNQDSQRQVVVPELQMQVSQGSNQVVSPYAAISSSFPNQTVSPPVPSYSLHNQQSHAMSPQQLHSISPRNPHVLGNSHTPNPQHQAYAIRLAKERQMQQRLQQQQQQQFPSHSTLMPHVQSQAHLPISSPHSTSHIPSQATSPPISLSPLTPGSPMMTVPQHQQQHQMMPHGLAQNAQTANSMANQLGKPRQRQTQQQFSQSGRHHPQQRQQTQSQQQGKALKGLGRGNMMMHQKMAMESAGGLSANTGNHSVENGEQPMHLLQNQAQGLYTSSAMNPVSAGKPLVRQPTNLSQPVQRMLAGQAPSTSKHLQQMPCNSDGINQGQVSPVSGGPLSADQQSAASVVMAGSGQQLPKLQARAKMVSQSQLSVQRMLHQNHHLNSEQSSLQGREPQHDQIRAANSSQMATAATTSQGSDDVLNVTKVVSPACATPWGGSELYDSSASSPAAQLGTSGTPSSSGGTEPSSQVGQGPGERHSSDNLPSGAHEQWQQKPAHLQPSSHVLQRLQQQQQSSQQQMLPLSVSQPQTQLMGSMYVRPPDTILE